MRMNRAQLRVNRSESQLVDWVMAFLVNEGYKVRAEVPSLGQSADLVATRGRWVTFVEVKVHDWRRAFYQCRAHALVADYICIALGTKQVSRTALEMAMDKGIGLIHVASCGTCDWSIRPTRNESIWPPQRRQLSQVLRVIEHDR